MKNFLQLRDRKIELGKKTLIMGILNVTPDSFSDGGFFYSADTAFKHAKKLVEDGADIIDIGAESTRPNFTPIGAEEEISRLEKIIPAVKKLNIPISIDTYKHEVAEFALKLGADIINDIQGLKNPKMIEVAKKFSAPVIAMHNLREEGSGKRDEKNLIPHPTSQFPIIEEVKKYFIQTSKICEENNLQVIFDVGIGFNKTQEENLTLLKNLREFKDFPTLLGVSRKSVIGYATGFEVSNRDETTGAICVFAISQGVDIVRVHNVKMISKMCTMADFLIR